jgi:hypothetical protein
MKQSIRNVVSPDFHAAYRNDRRYDGNRPSRSSSSSSLTSSVTALTSSKKLPLESDHTHGYSTGGNSVASNQDLTLQDGESDVCDFDCNEYCENIDQAMLCLGQEPGTLLCSDRSCLSRNSNPAAEYSDRDSGFQMDQNSSIVHRDVLWHPYDWLLDGDPINCETPYNDDDDDDKDVPFNDFERISLKEQRGNDRFIVDQEDESACGKEEEEEEETLGKVLAGLELEDVGSGEMNCVDGPHPDSDLQVDSMFVKVDDSEVDNDIQNDASVTSSDIPVKEYKEEQLEKCTLELEDASKYWAKSTDWIEKWDPLPDFLPFEDPSTPEGVFIRRWQSKRDGLHGGMDGKDVTSTSQDAVDDSSSACCDVPSYHRYCDENHDAFLDILTGVPWDELMQDNGNDNISAIDQDAYLIEILSSLDELSKDVSHELLWKVKQRETEIHDEMKRVQDIDRDVARALVDLGQATSLLQRARGMDEKHGGSRVGLLGGLYIIEESQSRNRLRELNELLMSVEEMVVMEASISEFVDKFSVDLLSDGSSITTFFETCENVKKRLFHDDRFCRLCCFDEARGRIGNVLDDLCRRIEEELSIFLFQACNRNLFKQETTEHGIKSILHDYSKLFEARLLLEGNSMQTASKGNREIKAESEQVVHDIPSMWSSCIYKSLCFEADRCLPRALLDPIHIDGWTDTGMSDFDSNLTEIKMKLEEIQYFGQDAASIQSLTSNLLTIRLEFDQVDVNAFVGIFHALCSLLANVLQLYNVLTQWHKEKAETITNLSAESRSCTPINGSQSFRALHVTHVDDSNTKEDYTKSTSSSNYSQSSDSSHHAEYRHQHFNAIPQCVSTTNNSNVEVDIISNETSSGIDEDIIDGLLHRRHDLWLHCQGIIVKFLNAIILSLDKKERRDWSVTWLQDLESLHDIYRLYDQMHKLGREIICCDGTKRSLSLYRGNDVQCEIGDALTKLFLGYLRGAHVESMTEIGTMIASETWDLLPFSIGRSGDCDVMSEVHCYIKGYISEVRNSIDSMSKPKVIRKLWSNQPNRSNEESVMHDNACMSCGSLSQEADKKVASNVSSCVWSAESTDLNMNDCRLALYKKVELFSSKSADEIILASKTALNGLARWTVRLQAIQDKLPLISDQVESIICNLYDLYFLSVFRLCVRDGRSEAIILGNMNRSDHNFHERFPKDLPPPQPRSATLRNKVLNRMDSSHLVTKFFDADINAPLDPEDESIIKIRNFVLRGQKSLSSMVNLDRIETWKVLHNHDNEKEEDDVTYSAKCMEKLFAASSSTLFVACLFEGCISDMNPNLDSPFLKYYKEMMEAICGMHEICLQMCSTRAIMAERVVSNVSASNLIGSF